MSILLIYGIISLGFGVREHVKCEEYTSRVMSKGECKTLGYITAPLWPIAVVHTIKNSFDTPAKANYKENKNFKN